MSNALIFLDSSADLLSIGISINGKLIDQISYEAWQTQSEYMVKELDSLLTKYNIDKNDISSVVTTIGPGSYTGVRISLTIAKTLAVALNIPIYTLSSLIVLQNYDKTSICIMNARNHRNYFAVYDKNMMIEKDQILTDEEVEKYIDNHQCYEICGDCSHLNLKGYKSDIIFNMFKLIKNVEPVANPLSVKPVYLKDDYGKH